MGETSVSSYFCIIRRYITMMVIRGSLATAYAGIVEDVVHNFPADRCVWESTYNQTTREYQLTSARFFAGDNTSASFNVDEDLEFGYIGKSGRFVAITQ